jgi:phosphohistidine phosphatase SixA
VQASHAAWWIVTGAGAAVLVLGLFSTTRRAEETARRVADELEADAAAPAPAAELIRA